MQVHQRLYLLSLLQSPGLQRFSLHLLFNALVINKFTYALPAYANQLTADDKNRVNAIIKFDIDALIDKSDRKLFRQLLSQVTVCTIFALIKPPPTVLTSFVRGNVCFPLFNIRSLKIAMSIVVYLNMYNLPVVISRGVSLGFS